MLNDLWGTGHMVLGLDQVELSWWQMAVRAIVVYLAAILMLRLGEKRFMGKNTAFDVILGIVLGSVISRAITGNAPFFPTLGAGFVLVGMHWIMAATAFHADRFGTIIKGSDRLLVDKGKILWEQMRKSHISEKDLISALRLTGKNDLSEVESARFERSGDITFVTKEKDPRVINVDVNEGVKTVRIEIG